MKLCLRFLLVLLPIITSAQEISTYPEEIYSNLYDFEMDGNNIIALGSCSDIWTSTDLGKNWSVFASPESMYDVALLPNNPNQAIILAFRQVWLYDFDQGIVTDFTSDLNEIDGASGWFVETTDEDVLIFSGKGIIRSKIGEYDWSFVYQDTVSGEIPNAMSTTGTYIYYGMRKGRVLRYNKQTEDVVQVQDIGESVRGLSMVNDQLGYLAIGGGILKTTDGWQTYVELDELPEGINPMAYGEDIILTINTNRIYRSTDGGQTATYIQTDIGPEFSLLNHAEFTDDGTLYGVGNGSMFVKSTDFGETFEHVNPIDRNNFYDSAIQDNGVGYVVGENNIMVKTEDHGESWVKMDNPDTGTDHYFEHVEIMNDGKVFVAGGEYYQLLDGDQEVYRSEQYLQAVLYNREKDYLLALTRVESGVYNVVKSTDQGRNWNVSQTFSEDSYFISQSPTGRIYMPLEEGHVMISDDEGDTWSDVKMADSYIREVVFFDDSFGLMLVGREILKTTDGGENFEVIANTYGIRGVTIVSEDHYYYVSSNQSETYFYETLNGGESFINSYHQCSATNTMTLTSENKVILGQRYGHINLTELSTPTSNVEFLENRPSMIFPNPVRSGMEIQVNEKWESIEVYNIQGGKVLTLTGYKNEISTENLDAGVYIMKVNGLKANSVTKFVVL